ncbi:MAG TPA: monofunctional biosynthetic peptidoglycan transglycosylase, partial [Caldimonas sp.]|nr:monofunctional biosynthetic peptidoglycan transglycosylase [Caldimonas sp.]
MKSAWRSLLRLLALVVLSALALQLYFLGRVAMMAWLDPQSTAFQRSEAWRLATHMSDWKWHQQWVPYERIAENLKRAVIASE